MADRQSTASQPHICQVRRWTGTHTDIGVQVAAHLQRQARRGAAQIARWRAWRNDSDAVARGQAIAAALARIWPPLLDEMCAMAGALAIDPRGVLAEWAAPPVPRALRGEGRSCTVFWVPPRLSDSGRPLVGRNFDLRLADPDRLLVYTVPAVGYAHCGMAGRAGRAEGINSAGLVVGTTEAQVRPGVLHPAEGGAAHGERIGMRAAVATGAIPARLATRIILERCATVAEAVELLGRLAQWTHFNFLVADALGAAAVVEVGVQRTAVRWAGQDGSDWLVTTNHFVSPELAEEADFRWMTRQKYQATIEGLDKCARPLTPQDAQRVLARPGVAQRHITLWSAAYEAGGPYWWFAPGRPDRNEYLTMEAPGHPQAGSGAATRVAVSAPVDLSVEV